jgi:hypothetical protein
MILLVCKWVLVFLSFIGGMTISRQAVACLPPEGRDWKSLTKHFIFIFGISALFVCIWLTATVVVISS